MGYFLPSFLQKRILRYALSKLELLETQDFDLDNLDIAWGKTSTIELRDIGVSTYKLAALLQLPPALTLSKATVLLLRVTIPADLYNSGIVVEVEGVNIIVDTRIKEEQPDKENVTSTTAKTRASGKGAPIDRPKGTRPGNEFCGGPASATYAFSHDRDANEVDEVLPTTFDLAQSFLQAEPPEERAEIRAAVAESQLVDQSQVLGESAEDATSVGIGSGISLPSFLADFLKGIRDRLQLSIRNVDISLNTQVELLFEDSHTKGNGPKRENFTIQFSVEKIDANGMTTESSTHESAKRRISLHNVQCMLAADPSLFANLSRISVPPSPVANQDSTYRTSSSGGQASMTRDGSMTASSQSRSIEPEQVARTISSNHGTSDPVTFKGASDAGFNDETAPPDNDSPSAGYEQAPEPGESQYLDSVLTGSFFSQPESSYLSAETHTSLAFADSSNRSHQLQNAESGSQNPFTYQDKGLVSFDDSCDPTDQASSEAAVIRKDSAENLAESKIFSHEEAQSMYMSAMSHGWHRNDRSHHNMPGNWESSGSEEESFATVDSSSKRSQSEQQNYGSYLYQSAQSASSTSKEAKPASKLPHEDKVPVHELSHEEIRRPAADDLSSTEETLSSNSGRSSAKSDEGLFIVKKIICVDSIAIEIPLAGGYDKTAIYDSQPFSNSTPDSSCGGLPKPPKQNASHRTATQGLGEALGSGFTATGRGSRSSASVEVGDAMILGDIGLTKLTILVVQRFLDTIRQNSHTGKPSKTPSIARKHTEIAMTKVSWHFLDNVRGYTTSESQGVSPETRAAPICGSADILLKALFSDVKISVDRDGCSSISTITVRKLITGYETDTILAFDSGLKLRKSNRDILAPVDNDVVLKISESPERTHIELTTLPLHVNLDLRRLDETFGWFGGFSSILGLGSSMISTVTVTEAKSKSHAGKHVRGVRFENTPPPLQQHEIDYSSQPKITARLGGIVFDLEGNSSAFKLETSAVKLVSRVEGVGLSVDRLNLAGPYLNSQVEKPSISVKLAGLRAEYLSNPKEVDLTRLLALLCPSKDNYEEDDDILVDTLLRQRRQGGVMRINMDCLESDILDIHDLQHLPALGDDLKKLSTVAKYLPEDDRPGIMTLFLIRDTQVEIHSGCDIGVLKVSAKTTEAAYISLPSLTALSIGQLEAKRNDVEELLGVVSHPHQSLEAPIPMMMARFIGNELEPTVKLKLQGLRAEYHVTTVMAALGLSDDVTTEQLFSDMLASVTTITARPERGQSPSPMSAATSMGSEEPKPKTHSLGLDVVLSDVVIGLNPRNSAARAIVVLSNSRVSCSLPKNGETSGLLEVKKASLLAIDDASMLNNADTSDLHAQASLLQRLSALGYVPLIEVSAAKGTTQILEQGSEAEKRIDVELRDALLVIETCADSTQTLQTILSGLRPPMPPSKDLKYRTEVMPVEDMLASFSGEAVATHQHGSDGIYDPDIEEDGMENQSVQDLEFVSSFYAFDSDVEHEDMVDSVSENLDFVTASQATLNVGKESLVEDDSQQARDELNASALDFREDHFGNNSTVGGTAHRWDTKRNTYELANDAKLRASPVKLRLCGIHIIWNLFDGYDWARTRDTIDQAVAVVEGKATEQRSRRDKRRSLNAEGEGDSVIGDFLFNSIYIGISGNHDPKDLSRQINRNIDDIVSESESYATSTSSCSPSRQSRVTRGKSRKLRLTRSKSHKMTFELKEVSVDFVVFPTGQGETQSSIDVRVQDLEVFDHLPTSTWKKFATYMQDAGERESGTSMVHIELLNVRPVPDLAASEIILKVRHLKLRR